MLKCVLEWASLAARLAPQLQRLLRHRYPPLPDEVEVPEVLLLDQREQLEKREML